MTLPVLLTISGPVPYWPPLGPALCGARKMSPLPLSAPLVSTVTGGACVLVVADPDEHEATAAHTTPIASAAATLNVTRTPENPLPPPKAPRTPYNEQLTAWFPPRRRHATAATATGSARPSIWNQA